MTEGEEGGNALSSVPGSKAKKRSGKLPLSDEASRGESDIVPVGGKEGEERTVVQEWGGEKSAPFTSRRRGEKGNGEIGGTDIFAFPKKEKE